MTEYRSVLIGLALLVMTVLTTTMIGSTAPTMTLAKSEHASDHSTKASTDNGKTTTSSDQTSNGDTTSDRAKSDQPSRVGSHDTQTSKNGADKGGTVTDPTLCSQTDNSDCKTTVKSDCFGKVISHRAQEHKENPDEGTLGSHASDPVPELPGHETPRQGIGNQDQGHPAAHGAFNSQFDADDEQNVVENC
jgi:hypothetical protein